MMARSKKKDDSEEDKAVVTEKVHAGEEEKEVCQRHLELLLVGFKYTAHKSLRAFWL